MSSSNGADEAALEKSYSVAPPVDVATAEELLNRLLEEDIHDYDALLASGDNYIAWADEDPAFYDNAFSAYMRIMDTKHSQKDEPWFRLLRYFIRTDQLEETIQLKNRFEADPKKAVNPEIYAELGGYLITKGELDDVKTILTRTMETKVDLPETYYHFSRYFREMLDPIKEEEALKYAIQWTNGKPDQ